MPFVSGDKFSSTNRVALTVGAAQTQTGSDLVAGTYLLSTNADCYIKHGASGLTVSATDFSVFLARGGGMTLTVDTAADSKRVAVIRDGTSAGTLMIQQVTASL